MARQPPDRGADDASLLIELAAGDRQAFAMLFHRYQASVYRFARQMGGSRETAEDVTQDVFIALIQTAGRFDPRLGSVTTYLYGITRNLLRRRLRAGASQREVELDGVGESAPALQATAAAHSDLERAQAVATLRRAIAALPAHYREVIVLCELHELSYEEAARVVGCPLGTIRSRLNRARRVLGERCRLAADVSTTVPEGSVVRTEPRPRRCLAQEVVR